MTSGEPHEQHTSNELTRHAAKSPPKPLLSGSIFRLHSNTTMYEGESLRDFIFTEMPNLRNTAVRSVFGPKRKSA